MAKTARPRDTPAPSVVRPRAQRVPGPVHEVASTAAPAAVEPHPVPLPTPIAVPTARRLSTPAVAALVGAKKIKEKCCRSKPRCKGCPVVLMRAARLQESGLTGKDLKKAVKRARAA